MVSKKRKRVDGSSYNIRKRVKLVDETPKVQQAVLNLCYRKVTTLREYCLCHLPTNSRVRKKTISTATSKDEADFLDSCLVGVLDEPSPSVQQQRTRDLVTFTQSQAISSDLGTRKGQSCSVLDIVDFAIWMLFNRTATSSSRPRHILCNGLQRASANQIHQVTSAPKQYLPGIIQPHPNENLTALKQGHWSNLFSLLGADGERIFSNLLLDCGIFIQLKGGVNNFYQLSGIPVTDLKCLPERSESRKSCSAQHRKPRTPSEISFVRSRILYARPSLNSKGQIRFGLQHVHVLQRFPDSSCLEHTARVMKYIFPKQFRLHNVFTSDKDLKETSQPFHDYTYRESELLCVDNKKSSHLPRRLRGAVIDLIRRVQHRHRKCPYTQLLRHFCPPTDCRPEALGEDHGNSHTTISGLTDIFTQSPTSSKALPCSHVSATQENSDRSFLTYATPTANVAAFCKFVICKLLPKELLGNDADGIHNWQVTLNNVEKFIKIRRFETLSLQNVSQNIRLACIKWLCPPKIRPDAPLSKNERDKRLEILHEILYYIFDSFLIPLIRSNFYVTESAPYRNKLFYFRHDVWKKMSEPSLAIIKLTMYEPIQPGKVRRMLSSRSLGYSHVRLLPKDQGVRVITNLRRRAVKIVGGKRILGPSINSQLGPLFSILNHERSQNSSMLGGALFSISGLHERLKNFQVLAPPPAKYFFVKVDIKSCFDSIPQASLNGVLRAILRSPQYRTSKYAKLKTTELTGPHEQQKLRKQYISIAKSVHQGAVFSESIADEIVASKTGLLLAEAGNQKVWDQGQLLRTLHEHVQNNIVKFGKKHFRQKDGIPQGSILSSLFCSFFYSAFEIEALSFLTSTSSMLVRLIDDFLLVTTKEHDARHFLQIMSKQDNRYGIIVNTDKTLVNFDITINGEKVPQHHGSRVFPYCGLGIDMVTLGVSKERQRKDLTICNGLTVDRNQKPVFTLDRKVISYMKLQMHAMLLDTSLNGKIKVFRALMESFVETAMKLQQYIRGSNPPLQLSETRIMDIIKRTITIAHKLCCSRQLEFEDRQTSNTISRSQICWIASVGFEQVLQRKQTRYKYTLKWLCTLKHSTEVSMGMSRDALAQLKRHTANVFAGYVY